MKKLLILIFLFSFAHAQEISSDTTYLIFSEATLFFMLFGTMWIISFFISRKHADEYEQENPLLERKAIVRERNLTERFLPVAHLRVKQKDKTAVLLRLSRLLKKYIINDEEFEILKKILNSGSTAKSLQ